MKHPVHQIVNRFFELKEWHNKPKEFYRLNKISYSRYTRVAKRLLEKCGGDVDLAKDKMFELNRWAKENNLDWSIETVLSRWDENTGKVEQALRDEEIAKEKIKRSDTTISEEQRSSNKKRLNKMKQSLKDSFAIT